MSRYTICGLAALGVISLLMILITHSALWALFALLAFAAISWIPGEKARRESEENAHQVAEEKPAEHAMEKQAKKTPVQEARSQLDELRKIREQRETEIKEKRIAEIDQSYKAFLAGDGRLPSAFSSPYRMEYSDHAYNHTPFESYLESLKIGLDELSDSSGVSEWLHLDDSSDIHAAVAELIEWISRNRTMNEIMQDKCHIGNTIYPALMRTRCRNSIMVVVEDDRVIEQLTEAEIARCREAKLSFCTILSKNSLYDLLEKEKRVIECEEYPGSVDDAATYGRWYFETAAHLEEDSVKDPPQPFEPDAPERDVKEDAAEKPEEKTRREAKMRARWEAIEETRRNPAKAAPPELVFSPEEREWVRSLLDSFFCTTEWATKDYQEALIRKDSYNGWCAHRISRDATEAVVMDESSWNYHDESWTDYKKLYAERITLVEYEQEIADLAGAAPSNCFFAIAKSAKHCHAYEAPYGIGSVDYSSHPWTTYAVAYMTGFPSLAGYFRFTYAYGNNR